MEIKNIDAVTDIGSNVTDRSAESNNSIITQPSIKLTSWLKSRLAVQLGFMALCIWIGWEFVGFVNGLRANLPVNAADRPPGVEGFLPISSMMELWLWIKSGIAPQIHPAGVVIISFAIGGAVLIKRGFCSWLCPVGTVSEALWRLGAKIGLNWTPWRWLDIPLRALKYILLAFFLYVIFGMSTEGLQNFITGNYNRISDIKMLDYFNPPSRFALSVIGILALLSVVLKNFWCRYLCPYGALLGIFSRVSPMAIRRNADTCTDCDKCDKACPSYLPVATSLAIKSEECISCQQCVAVCPVQDCLEFSAPRKKFSIKPVWYGVVFLLLFLGSVGTARYLGYWRSTIPVEHFQVLIKDSEKLDHPRSISGYK